MKRLSLFLFSSILCLTGAVVQAGESKTLASTMEVYVFPKAGQKAEQQSQDEASCYEWATGNTGLDPFDVQKKKETQVAQADAAKDKAQSSGKGAGAAGAVSGAVKGAIIGEVIDDDASDGAKYGAAAGAISARRKAKRAKQQATNQAEQQKQSAQTTSAEQLTKFKKAFSVCLEAKDYMVKY